MTEFKFDNKGFYCKYDIYNVKNDVTIYGLRVTCRVRDGLIVFPTEEARRKYFYKLREMLYYNFDITVEYKSMECKNIEVYKNAEGLKLQRGKIWIL